MSWRAVATTPEAPWVPAACRPAEATPTVALGPARQPFHGFGVCFNELGWEAILTLPADEADALVRELFADDGLGLAFGRIPIGANDYAVSWYSCDEVEDDLDLNHFGIGRDRLRLIPYLRAAQAVRPDLWFFASPWSPPTWMKSPAAYNYGTLRWEPAVRQAYARYLLRFVQAYQAEGVPIRQLHVQNEPDSDQKFPSCRWTGERLRDFIRDDLGPVFREAGDPAEIWLGTIERGKYDDWIAPTLDDDAARAFVRGVGFQWDGRGAVQPTRAAWPDLPLMQTESECGDGRNDPGYARHLFRLIHHYTLNGVSAYAYWNAVLPAGGVSTWGWRQNSLVSVADGRVVRNPEFHVLRHASAAGRPGSAVREVSGRGAVHAVAFARPDGTSAVTLMNPRDVPWTEVVEADGVRRAIDLPPRSFATVFTG